MLRQLVPAGAREVDGLEQAVQQSAGAGALGEGEDGGLGHLCLLRQRGGRLGRHLVIEAGIGQHPLAMAVALSRQPGVGADPPVPLELTGEVAHLGLAQLHQLGCQRGRAAERGLTDGHSG
ncbi:hypothetical protein D3C76_942410 [compost metagenome]